MAIISKELNVILLRLAFVLIFIQNLFLLLGSVIPQDSIIILFYLDLVGFSVLAIGYLIYFTQDSERSFLWGGLGILGWVVSRVINQFVILGFITQIPELDTSGYVPTGDIIQDIIGELIHGIIQTLSPYAIGMAVFFVLSGISLGIGAYFIWQAQGGIDGLFFAIYSLTNLVLVLMIGLPIIIAGEIASLFALGIMTTIPFALKFLLVPILALITCFIMFLRVGKLT